MNHREHIFSGECCHMAESKGKKKSGKKQNQQLEAPHLELLSHHEKRTYQDNSFL